MNDCEANVASNIGNGDNSKYDEQECTVGEQLFLSNPSRSNENLIDSTAGSCDPLFANQSLEQINLGESIMDILIFGLQINFSELSNLNTLRICFR